MKIVVSNVNNAFPETNQKEVEIAYRALSDR